MAALVFVLLVTTPLAFSQSPGSNEQDEAVAPTGTRLKEKTNLAGSGHVYSASGDEARIRRNIRIEDFVNILPQVFAGQASEISSGATGTGTLDLRGLGAERTLVLIDGRRLPYGSSRTVAVNTDLVPLPLVERVDILTGGGAAAYGSDAIGGVANFILKRNFDGFEIGGQYGQSFNGNDDDFYANVLDAAQQPVPGSASDGGEGLVYALMGVNSADGRSNITLYAGYEDRREILQTDREFSGCALGQDDGPLSVDGFSCVGSANFRLFGGPGGFGFQQENGRIDDFFTTPASTRVFNLAQSRFFQRPAQRYNVYARGHYELANKVGVFENVKAFADLSYVNNQSDAQIEPTSSFGIGLYNINCGNPLIQGNAGVALTDLFGCSDADIAADNIVDGITASHRNVEGGGRNTRLENSAWRLVSGLRGKLAQNWDWEAFLQLSETRDDSVSTNDFVRSNVQQALLATTDAAGNIVCTDQTGGCVPYNIFQRGPNGESLVTQDALNFIQGTGLVDGSTRQTVFGANIQSSLEDYGVRLPTADESVAVLFGVELRTDELNSLPDEISRLPDGGFTGSDEAILPVEGQLETSDFFVEIDVPILSGKPLAKELTLRTQYRYSDYTAEGNNTSNDFDASTYGVSLAWAPVADLRFRAQFQRAVRAPNVIELFAGQSVAVPGLVTALFGTPFDPCASDAPVATLEQCQRTGVTAAQYGNIPDPIVGQTQALTGGNPGLTPEEADTFTFGVTWTPAFIDNLALSIDYFNILVEDAITPGLQTSVDAILDQCLITGEATFCDLITRDSSGSLAAGTPGVGFDLTNINVAELETTGVDLQASYGFAMGAHTVNLDYVATILDQLDTTTIPGFLDARECAGFFGAVCGTPSPEFRHRAMVTWKTPWRVDVMGTWRHFGETDNDNPLEMVETTLDSVNYIDIAATWNITDDLLIRGSALNVFGEDPPTFTGAGPALGNGNTYPTVYDISRVLTASFQYSF